MGRDDAAVEMPAGESAAVPLPPVAAALADAIPAGAPRLLAAVRRCRALQAANAALLATMEDRRRGTRATYTYSLRWRDATTDFAMVEMAHVAPAADALDAWRPDAGACGGDAVDSTSTGTGTSTTGGAGANAATGTGTSVAPFKLAAVHAELDAAEEAMATGVQPPLAPPLSPMGIRPVHGLFHDELSYAVTGYADLARLNGGMLRPLMSLSFLGDTPLALAAAATFVANYEAVGAALGCAAAAAADGERQRDALAAAAGRINGELAALAVAAVRLAAEAATEGGSSATDNAHAAGSTGTGTSGSTTADGRSGGVAAMAALAASNAATIAAIRHKAARYTYTYTAVAAPDTLAVTLVEKQVATTALLVDAWEPAGMTAVPDVFDAKLPLPAPRGLAQAEELNKRMVEVARKYDAFRDSPLCATAQAVYLANYRALAAGLTGLAASLHDGERVGSRLDGEVAAINAAVGALRAACAGGRDAVGGISGDGGHAATPAAVVVEAAHVTASSAAAADAAVAALPASVTELVVAAGTPAMRFGHLPRLRVVCCRGTGVGDTALASLPVGVAELDVRDCAGVTAASTLAHLPALTALHCAGTGMAAAAARPQPPKYEWSDTAVLSVHSSFVYALAQLPDGRLASGGDDGSVRLWDPARGGDEVAVLEGHDGAVCTLAPLPGGGTQQLAVGVSNKKGATGFIALWNTAVTPPVRSATVDCGSGAYALAVLPDGRLAVGCHDGKVRVVDVATAAVVATLEGHGGSVWALAVLPNGRLASGSGDGSVRVWEVARGVCVTTLEGHTGAVYALVALLDGRLASGSRDTTVRVWEPGTGSSAGTGTGTGTGTHACTAVLAGHTQFVMSVAALPDGRLASGSGDATVRLWDVRAGAGTGTATVATLAGHGGNICALAALPGGRLASASDDETVRLWALPSV